MAGATCFNDTIHGRLCSVAATRPDSPAVLHLRAPGRAAVVFSFAELVAASQALAVVLRASARVPPGADEGAVPCVAVLLDSTPARIVAYFAVLFAQLAFCPLELGHPRSVLRATLDAVRPVLLVSTPELASSLLGEEAGGDVVPRVLLCPHTGTPLLVRRGCDDGSGAPPRVVPRTPFAHASFTSGTTTGTPRCMAVGHGGSLASHAWRASLAQPSSTDVTACNVFGVWDAACSLLSGSPVALVPDGVARDGAAHGRALLRVGAIRLLLTPSLAARLLDDPVGAAAVGRLRVLTLCGERLSPFLRRALVNALPRGAALVNLYSLAEAHDVGAHVTRVGEESADSTVGAEHLNMSCCDFTVTSHVVLMLFSRRRGRASVSWAPRAARGRRPRVLRRPAVAAGDSHRSGCAAPVAGRPLPPAFKRRGAVLGVAYGRRRPLLVRRGAVHPGEIQRRAVDAALRR